MNKNMNIDRNINIWLVQSSATIYFFCSLYVIFVCISIIASSTFILTPSLSICFFFTHHILSSIPTYKYTYICTHLRPVPFLFLSYHIISYPIISYHVISYPIISYPIISYHVISYSIISYPIISYLVPNTSPNLVLSQSFRLTSMP